MAKESPVDAATLSNPFLDRQNPLLDPAAPEFRYEEWLAAIINMKCSDPSRFPDAVAGIACTDLSVDGSSEQVNYQRTFGNYPLVILDAIKRRLTTRDSKVNILYDFDGLVRSGEALLVLGRPGRYVSHEITPSVLEIDEFSGCSTLLKALAGEMEGLSFSKHTHINYQGIPHGVMHKDLRGNCIYQAEIDQHFPQLTVGQTLEFAAAASVCNRPSAI